MLRRYFLKRLLVAVPSLLIASVIVFSLVRLIPGDVVTLMMEENQYAQDLEEMRRKLGLDRPIHLQYLEWIGRALRGDLGQSLYTGRPVLGELATRLPVSLELGAIALLVSIVVGVPIGVVSAVRQDSAPDYVARSGAILGLSVPGFWLGTLVVVLPAIYLGWSPSIQYVAFAADPSGHVVQFLVPGFLLGIASAATVMRLTRTQLLEVLRQDYVRTAWAKGLAERRVVLKHCLKNALIPVVTVLGIQVAQPSSSSPSSACRAWGGSCSTRSASGTTRSSRPSIWRW
jgi:peptide/nickel transport system permease protein